LKLFPVCGIIYTEIKGHSQKLTNKLFAGRKEKMSDRTKSFYLTASAFLILFSCCNRLSAKKLIVPDEYQTIMEAVEAADANDTVFIKAGVYNEQIRLGNGVKLIGEGMDKVTVKHKVHHNNVILCRYGNFEIKGMTIEQTHEGQISHGVSVAVFVVGASGKISDCRIKDAPGHGLAVKDRSHVVIQNCIIESNAYIGVYVIGNGASVESRGNKFSNNGKHGISFEKGANGIVENTICENNKSTGVFANHPESEITVRNSEFAGNERYGIYFGSINRGVVENNICSQNNNIGIYVTEQSKDVTVANNQCIENGMHGICFYKQSFGTIENNICRGNYENGIAISDYKSNPILKNNQAIANTGSGLYFVIGSSAVDVNNICRGNRGLTRGYLRRLLIEERFDELEQLAARLRKDKTKSLNGGSQLSYFYDALSERWGEPNENRNNLWPAHSKRKEQAFWSILERWKEQKPDSVTPLIVMAATRTHIGWIARGGGWAYEVTDRGWEIFHEELQKSWDIWMEAEKMDANDPALYRNCLWTALGMSKSNEELNEIFEKGVAIDPNYAPLYLMRATTLLPKWKGIRGELEAFAASAADSTKDKLGETMYARIAANVLEFTVLEHTATFDFSYERIQQGFLQLMEGFPNSEYFLNSYCAFACLYEDKETSKELFDKIADDWRLATWREKEVFNNYKAWANNEITLGQLNKNLQAANKIQKNRKQLDFIAKGYLPTVIKIFILMLIFVIAISGLIAALIVKKSKAS
jgi:parallel beta-helix repeat protein